MAISDSSRHFYLCRNPGFDVPDGVLTFIYGSSKPRFFASLSRLDSSLSLKELSFMGISLMFYFHAPGDDRPFAYLLRVSDNIDKAGYDELAEVLGEVAQWYCYGQAEAAGQDTAEIGWLVPFSSHLKGVQLLEDKASGQCLLNFAVGCQGFSDMDGALQFLEKDLKIDRELIYTGGLAVNN